MLFLVEPLNCTRTPYTDIVYGGNNNTYSAVVNLFDCEGGCGQDQRYCCQPREVETVMVELTKQGETPINKEVTMVINKNKQLSDPCITCVYTIVIYKV